MQDPLGFWRLNATLAVRMKKLMSGVSKSKPPGCPPEVSQYAFLFCFFSFFFACRWRVFDRHCRFSVSPLFAFF